MFLRMILHYFKRMAQDKIMILVFGLLPTAVLALNVLVMNANMEGYYHLADGYNIFATMAMVQILVLFAFFSTTNVVDYMHSDTHGNRRWRLMAAPTSFNKFIMAAIVASVAVALVSSLILVVAGRFIFNAYIPNIPMMIAVTLVLALMGQFLGVILFTFFRKKSQTEAITMILGFGMMVLAGGFMGEIDLGVTAVNRFFQEFTPFSLADNAILYAGHTLPAEYIQPGTIANFWNNMADMGLAFRNLGIMAGVTVILGIIAYATKGRREMV